MAPCFTLSVLSKFKNRTFDANFNRKRAPTLRLQLEKLRRNLNRKILSMMIGNKKYWTGIVDEATGVDEDPYGDFRFLDGTRSSIKRYDDEDPSEDEDVFIKWAKSAPDNYGNNENHVEVWKRGDDGYVFNDLSHTWSRYAFCERLKPDCVEGIFVLVSCEFSWLKNIYLKASKVSHILLCELVIQCIKYLMECPNFKLCF